MNGVPSIALLFLAALLPAFLSCIAAPVRLLGAQPEVLAPLMVCAGLSAGLPVITATSLLGGLCLDALSMNPPGVSAPPLFVIGAAIHAARVVLMARSAYAQSLMGAGAGALAPFITWLLLLTAGRTPVAGGRLLWILAVGALSGALLAPLFCALLQRLGDWFGYKPWPSPGFRPDREIVRPRR
jgi:cell shape-determining protein MreD